jgi:hypothetical protein
VAYESVGIAGGVLRESLIKTSWAHCLAVAFLAAELACVLGFPEDRAVPAIWKWRMVKLSRRAG